MSKDYPPYLDYPKPYKPMTNGDRIRAMSDEELANVISCPQEFFALMGCPDALDCSACKLDWLKQPAEVEK